MRFPSVSSVQLCLAFLFKLLLNFASSNCSDDQWNNAGHTFWEIIHFPLEQSLLLWCTWVFPSQMCLSAFHYASTNLCLVQLLRLSVNQFVLRNMITRRFRAGYQDGNGAHSLHSKELGMLLGPPFSCVFLSFLWALFILARYPWSVKRYWNRGPWETLHSFSSILFISDYSNPFYVLKLYTRFRFKQWSEVFRANTAKCTTVYRGNGVRSLQTTEHWSEIPNMAP